MNSEKFLGLETPEKYDFKFEVMAWYDENIKENKRVKEEKRKSIRSHVEQIFNQKEDSISRFILYRLFDDIKFDCDSSNGSCSLTNEIYRTLWGWSEDRFTGFGGDTMNSFWMILSKVIEKCYPTLYGEYKRERSQWLDAKRFFNVDNIGNDKNYKAFIEAIDIANTNDNELKAIYALLKEFATLTHTIGNFVLVPTGFNGFRGRRLNDRWDYSLEYLRDEFGRICFHNYIRDFDLIDYVGADNRIIDLSKQSGSNIIPLEKSQLPNNQESLKCFLENVNDMIKARGTRMVNELKKLKERQ